MQIRWYGQSAFLVTGSTRVVIDPFGSMRELASTRGMTFDYPDIEPVDADVLLVTHEHRDHNGVEVVTGDPQVIRSTAGVFESPAGTVVAVASEHDAKAGTERGPNAIIRFELDGLVLCHFGDFGQRALRPEQRDAIGDVDVLFLPVGDGATIGGETAAALVRELRPRLALPMHYRTPALNFLEPADAFLEAVDARIVQADHSTADVEPLLGTRDEPVVAVLAPPLR